MLHRGSAAAAIAGLLHVIVVHTVVVAVILERVADLVVADLELGGCGPRSGGSAATTATYSRSICRRLDRGARGRARADLRPLRNFLFGEIIVSKSVAFGDVTAD